MSQSLHAIKRFRLRELQIVPPPTRSRLRISPPPTTSAALSPDTTQRTTPQAPTKSDEPTSTSTSTSTLPVAKNPFVPHKNPESGRWAPPKYSLRRQAELIKHARASGTLHLLPPGPKMSHAQQQQQQQLSLAAKPITPALLAEEEAAVGVVGSGLVSLRTSRQGQEGEEEGKRVTVTVKEGQDAVDASSGAADADADAAAWMTPVEWVGTVRERSVAGADVGNRLYAGKKRMFKGHKWERMRERRVARTKILLRDMDKRVERFKGYRAKGKPLPLARRSNVLKKTQKLPF